MLHKKIISKNLHERRRDAARARCRPADDERRGDGGEHAPRAAHQSTVRGVRPPPRPRQTRPAPGPALEGGEEEPSGEYEGDKHTARGADDVESQL